MDEVVKNISNEKLDYYREHIDECPIDILRVLYTEKAESEAYLYDAYQDAGKKMFEYAEEADKLKRQVDIKNAYCNLIHMIGVDYDGLNSIGSLKSLIDELVSYAKRAVKNDDKYIVAESLNNKGYNILHEEVEKPENFDSMFKK